MFNFIKNFLDKRKEKKLINQCIEELSNKPRFNFFWDPETHEAHMIDVHGMKLYGNITVDHARSEGKDKIQYMAAYVADVTPIQAAMFYTASRKPEYKQLIAAKLRSSANPEELAKLAAESDELLLQQVSEIVDGTWKAIQQKIDKDKILEKLDEIK